MGGFYTQGRRDGRTRGLPAARLRLAAHSANSVRGARRGELGGVYRWGQFLNQVNVLGNGCTVSSSYNSWNSYTGRVVRGILRKANATGHWHLQFGLITIVAGAAAVTACASAPTSAIGTTAHSGPAAYASASTTGGSCGQGTTLVRATYTGEARVYGASIFKLVVAGKVRFVAVPPESFSPASATDGELLAFGYAARPPSGEALSQ